MSDEEDNDHNNNTFKNSMFEDDDSENTCSKSVFVSNLTNTSNIDYGDCESDCSDKENKESSSSVNNFVKKYHGEDENNANIGVDVESSKYIRSKNTLYNNNKISSESSELSKNYGSEAYDDTNTSNDREKSVSQEKLLLDCDNSFSEWGDETDRAEIVLSEVACWLNGRDLVTFGAVCSAWRAIASQPRPWRQALIAEHGLTTHSMQALADFAAETYIRWSWRSECLLSSAGWQLKSSLRAAGGAELLHAAASDCGQLVAIGADDASVTIWTQPDWTLTGCISLRDLGWATVARLQWAGGSTTKLLVAGPLVLAARWELVVLNVTEEKVAITSRAACGAGGASSWLRGGDTFLTLELRRAGPWLATTSVWLYSAKQETQSEHAGVAAPVLRVFNEGRAHFTHAAVVDVPEDAWRHYPADDDMDKAYYRATLKALQNDNTHTILVLAGGSSTSKNRATSLSVWELPLSKPPPVLACNGGDLRSRRLARAARPSPVEDEDEVGPDEETVRALCTPPATSCDLGARVLGLSAHPGARCVWTALDDGRLVCSGVPTLITLRVLGGGGVGGATHYLQPAISPLLLASPAVSARAVRVWCSRSGAECTPPAPTHASDAAQGPPVLQTLLLPTTGMRMPVMLVLIGDFIQVWRSRAPYFDHSSV